MLIPVANLIRALKALLPPICNRKEKMAARTIARFANATAREILADEGAETRVILAAYDTEKFKAGWKGMFVVHRHDADKAGAHWDVRLEWPVKSVAKSLHGYGHKGRGSDEPAKKWPEGPGSVLRSFVDRKMEVPAGDKKIYLVETEDHPMEYGKFHGEITEGYGKGTVDIWDKGTYELLDRKGGKQFTMKFHGKKLNGEYAMVRYNQGYLWVKVKHKKASVIDYPRPTLPIDLWDLKNGAYTLKPAIRDLLVNTAEESISASNLPDFKLWVKELYLTGSSTSNICKSDCDIDVILYYDPDDIRKASSEFSEKTNAEIFEVIKEHLYKNNEKRVVGTPHTFSFMAFTIDDMPRSEGIYDLLQNKWVRGPVLVPTSFDPDKAFAPIRVLAEHTSNLINADIDQVVYTEKFLRELDRFKEETGQDMPARRQELMNMLRSGAVKVEKWYEWVWSLSDRSCRPDGVYPAYDYSPNWEKHNILFKYIERLGAHRPVYRLYTFLKGSPYLKFIDQFIPD